MRRYTCIFFLSMHQFQPVSDELTELSKVSNELQFTVNARHEPSVAESVFPNILSVFNVLYLKLCISVFTVLYFLMLFVFIFIYLKFCIS